MYAGPIIDAYAHVGMPTFSRSEEVLAMFDRWSIERGALVLGPGVPDLDAVRRALELAPGRVRCMGIPFGATEAQRTELAEIQIRMGISGMRLMPREVTENGPVLERLGEAGLILYAINPYDSAECMRALLAWLEQYPAGRVASPHFLKPATIDRGAVDAALFRELMHHPRLFGILSRHGGNHAGDAYPHESLRPWIRGVVEHVTWERLMWGSEHPVIYWRNEQVDECIGWVDALGLPMTDDQRRGYLHDNAERLLFSGPPPSVETVDLPGWLDEQFNRDPTVAMLRGVTLKMSGAKYPPLMSEYLRRCESDKDLRFADFLVEKLAASAAR